MGHSAAHGEVQVEGLFSSGYADTERGPRSECGFPLYKVLLSAKRSQRESAETCESSPQVPAGRHRPEHDELLATDDVYGRRVGREWQV